jgi:hypothetical protein
MAMVFCDSTWCLTNIFTGSISISTFYFYLVPAVFYLFTGGIIKQRLAFIVMMTQNNQQQNNRYCNPKTMFQIKFMLIWCFICFALLFYCYYWQIVFLYIAVYCFPIFDIIKNVRMGHK